MSGIESDVAFNLLRNVYEENPNIFRPEYVVEGKITPEVITAILDQHRLRYKSIVNGRAWVLNSHRLYNHWGSDPRNLFIGTQTYEELAERVRNKLSGKYTGTAQEGMFGFQHKMVCMLAYFLTDASLVKVPYLFPVPVDFHHLRVHLATRMVVVRGEKKIRYTAKLLKAIRDLSMWYCRHHGLTSTNPIADAVWLLSKYLCSQYPGNASTSSPLKNGANGIVLRRSGKTSNKKLVWSPADVKAYYRSCGSCPIEEFCEIAIGAGQHYLDARLVLRGPRTSPPQQQLMPVHTKQVRALTKKSTTTNASTRTSALRPTFPLFHS